jgi:CDP-paratose 2-epimerase
MSKGSTHANLSLWEATALCRKITGDKIPISSITNDRPADVKWYITDNGDTGNIFNWRPGEKAGRYEDILSHINVWFSENAENFSSLFTRE